MGFHSAHGFENAGMLTRMAVLSSKTCGQHPALFLREVLDRVGQKCTVQVQLLGGWCDQQGVEHRDELFVRVVHALIACDQLIRPLKPCQA